MCLLGCGRIGDHPVRHLATAHPALVAADPIDRWPDDRPVVIDHTLTPGDFQEEQ